MHSSLPRQKEKTSHKAIWSILLLSPGCYPGAVVSIVEARRSGFDLDARWSGWMGRRCAGIPAPLAGYWMRKEFAKPVEQPSLPPAPVGYVEPLLLDTERRGGHRHLAQITTKLEVAPLRSRAPGSRQREEGPSSTETASERTDWTY